MFRLLKFSLAISLALHLFGLLLNAAFEPVYWRWSASKYAVQQTSSSNLVKPENTDAKFASKTDQSCATSVQNPVSDVFIDKLINTDA